VCVINIFSILLIVSTPFNDGLSSFCILKHLKYKELRVQL